MKITRSNGCQAYDLTKILADNKYFSDSIIKQSIGIYKRKQNVVMNIITKHINYLKTITLIYVRIQRLLCARYIIRTRKILMKALNSTILIVKYQWESHKNRRKI